jgi:hypothetical protein
MKNLYYNLAKGKAQTTIRLLDNDIVLNELTPRERTQCESDDELHTIVKTLSLSSGIDEKSLLSLSSDAIYRLYKIYLKMMNERAFISFYKNNDGKELLDEIIADARASFNLEYQTMKSLDKPNDMFGISPMVMTEGQQLVFAAIRRDKYYEMHPDEKKNQSSNSANPMKWTIDSVLRWKGF